MYNELIKDLRENHDKYFARDMEAADAIEELNREYESVSASLNESVELLRKLQKTKWIPVTERLPREQETVLTYNKQGAILLDWRHDNKWCCFGDVTHWMPLPEPPKESE